eukprot:CAMPEP_0197681850 /NCGR_PEP_ID=MMETSP1338-20131121/95565_1 /TAXON_ID=43686 ORGANISM="Pelagodinium beii, Strain RCC1491" /NCGR_SAMPLE_ID=MMETSP1338 /ASSEMBLY_ACC=CAM_ASM_000754 /LENGTH=150 /DNA_ID=CAMNT_0043263243 /DNA_START=62 /DNA_END=510 /DNA_ORIENTATION=-
MGKCFEVLLAILLPITLAIRSESDQAKLGIFNDPRIITDKRQIFHPKPQQLMWLNSLKGNGDAYIMKGAYAFALKQITYNDHVVVLMFKEQNQKATQFFVDGQAYAEELLNELQEEPSLFDSWARPSGPNPTAPAPPTTEEKGCCEERLP